MKKRFIQFSVLIILVLVVRACLRSSFPEYIPDGREYQGAEWRKNYNSIEPPRFGLRRVRKGNLYGYVDEHGKEAIAAEYPYLGCFRNNYTDIYAQKDGYWGTVSYKGAYNQLFKSVKLFPDFWKEQYYSVGYHSNGMAVVRSRHDMKYGFVDKKGMERVHCDYDAVGHFDANGLAWVKKHDARSNANTYGYVNTDGEEILPCKYGNVGFFNEGLAWFAEYNVALKTELHGFVDKTGKIVIPADYQSANDFKGGLAWVKKLDKVGFIDKNNNVVIPLEYDGAGFFFNDLVWLRKGDKYGVADWSGKMIVPLEYDEMGNYFSDVCRARKGKEVFLIDRKGKIIYTAEDINAISEGKAAVKVGGKWGFINIATASYITKPSYDEVYPFFSGYAIVANNKKYGIIDSLGKVLMPLECESIGLWGKDQVRLKKKKWWYFFNVKNGHLNPTAYNDAWNYKNDVALVGKDGRFGYIDYFGTEITPFYENIGAYAAEKTAYKADSIWHLMVNGEVKKFKYASSFTQELAFVDYDKIIKPNGDIAFSLEFQNNGSFSEGLMAIKIDGSWGFVDALGDVPVPCTYDAVLAFSEGLAAVKTKGKWGFVDKMGRRVIPAIFDDVNSFHNGTAQVKLDGYRFELTQLGVR